MGVTKIVEETKIKPNMGDIVQPKANKCNRIGFNFFCKKWIFSITFYLNKFHHANALTVAIL